MATTAESARAAIEFGGVTPVLRVRDLAVSIDYYTRVLGFKINWGYPESGEAFFASVSRGKCCLFLSVGDQGHPGSWVWLDGKDVDAVYAEFKAAGAKIRNPPTNYSWALEMQVEDPDGNVLRIGSDNIPDQPLGSWLDMYGDRWGRTADGQPVRVEVK